MTMIYIVGSRLVSIDIMKNDTRDDFSISIYQIHLRTLNRPPNGLPNRPPNRSFCYWLALIKRKKRLPNGPPNA